MLFLQNAGAKVRKKDERLKIKDEKFVYLQQN